ncbi:MAG: apolipoprotein N-acyltransferase [Bacteroidetes bacterium]|nr:apolipoprotein N-acyltransferase [Bacteroidota bacterium]
MKQFFTFDKEKRFLVSLMTATAVILGFSFPPFSFGITAFFGFVPFLIMADRIGSYGRFFRYSYATFFFFSLISLYWVGGFTHGKDPFLMIAGAALFLWEPLVLSIPAMVYYFVRRQFRNNLSHVAFPFIWITMEWLYAYGELAFPWLHIGNTQTYQLDKIQFADITGVYGISLWVLVINVLVYSIILLMQSDRKRSKAIMIAVGIAILYVLPDFYAPQVPSEGPSDGVTIGIVQPNIDPWDKWEGADTFEGRWAQVERYLSLISSHIDESVDIVVLPESAILLNLPQFRDHMERVMTAADTMQVSILSGYVRVKYYADGTAPVTSNTLRGSTVRYDSYNSILFVQPGIDTVQSYSKMRLVPFAERIPYAEQIPALIEPLRWGVGISNWGLAKDSTLFQAHSDSVKFLAMVCYESIFPEFVAEFVKKGAEFLVFTTNDSWWGNTSGARQHNQYAVLRAIENRRWVARCANGGISSFIDPHGTMYDATDMYTETYIQRTIHPRTELTYYSRHGDWLARICASIALGILLFSISYTIYRKYNG